MLKVLEHEIDFDITSPADLQRYLAAAEEMDRAAADLPGMPAPDALQTREGLEQYAACVAGQCRLLTGFLDAAFGDGTCSALLGPKTSLNRLLEVCAALREALAAQGEQTASLLAEYLPNRAASRGGAV